MESRARGADADGAMTMTVRVIFPRASDSKLKYSIALLLDYLHLPLVFDALGLCQFLDELLSALV